MSTQKIAAIIAVFVPFGIPLLLSFALLCRMKKRFDAKRNQSSVSIENF